MNPFNWLRLRRAIKNQFENKWLRSYFFDEYSIVVGMYSYGCFDNKRIPPFTKIGRYCSFSNSCYILNGNHGVDFIALHPYLYNITLGVVKEETIKRTHLVVEDDVWIGHDVIILPSVTFIGRGAIVGAGSVVTKNIERYDVVAGNPAKVIKKRFNEEIISCIENTSWWLMSKDDLKELIELKPDLVFKPESFFKNDFSQNKGIL